MDDLARTDRIAAQRWRIALWSAAGALLLIPLVAMRLTDAVAWDAADFGFAGVLIVGTGLLYELAARASRRRAYRIAAGVALGTALLLVWINLAVGIIGSEDDPANLMFAGILAVAAFGTIVARARAPGMARAMVATAIAQATVGAIALALGTITLVPTAVFATLWLIAAWLFRKAAHAA